MMPAHAASLMGLLRETDETLERLAGKIGEAKEDRGVPFAVYCDLDELQTVMESARTWVTHAREEIEGHVEAAKPESSGPPQRPVYGA